MPESRRKILAIAAGAVSCLLPGVWRAWGQFPPSAGQQSGGQREDDALPPQPATKAILEANEKDIKKNVEKLFQLAGELKAQVEKTDSAKVLSLSLVKKAEEIEKLARQIKDRARG